MPFPPRSLSVSLCLSISFSHPLSFFLSLRNTFRLINTTNLKQKWVSVFACGHIDKRSRFVCACMRACMCVCVRVFKFAKHIVVGHLFT